MFGETTEKTQERLINTIKNFSIDEIHKLDKIIEEEFINPTIIKITEKYGCDAVLEAVDKIKAKEEKQRYCCSKIVKNKNCEDNKDGFFE